MAHRDSDGADFTLSSDSSPPESLVVGVSQFGLAGLTAVDYLADREGMTEIGHLSVEQLPAITPFADGRPRHHTRLYAGEEDVAVLVGELFVPIQAAPALAGEILAWAEAEGVEEITLLSGVPIAHGPEQHEPFFVATDDYRERRLADADIEPMSGGFVEGVNADLLQQGIDTDLRVGMLTTPVHQPAPDAEAALRLLDALAAVYDLSLDTGPLAEFAKQIADYYEELAARVAESEAEDRPEDRMYM